MGDKTLYVVAVSQREAEELADDIGHASLGKAEEHLRYVKESPTDPFYASQYQIYKVRRKLNG